MIACRLELRDGEQWCLDCERFHRGHALRLSQELTPFAQSHRDLWKTAPSAFKRNVETAKRCIHLGNRLTLEEVKERQLAGCRACNGDIVAFHCKLPGAKKFNEGPYTRISGECTSCDDWQDVEPGVDAPAGPRHLVYHIWPRKTSLGVWQRNLDQLKQRWSLFDGRRVIAVVTDGQSHDLATVQAYMKDFECEWLHFENNPHLREVLTFEPLFSRVEGLPGYTFYGQSKGVTKGINPGVSVHGWTQAMYESLLDYWPRVHHLLKKFPVVGSFKKSIAAFAPASRSQWHYSGSFCWIRNEALWQKNWREIDQHWYGIESWPSLHFPDAEAGVMFFESTKQFDLYEQDFWRSVEGKFKAWRRTMAPHRSGTGSLTTGSSP